MVCEHEYMNISPPNYRAGYGPVIKGYMLFKNIFAEVSIIFNIRWDDRICKTLIKNI